MTDRRLTDAQIAAALRAHLPAHAQAGLGSRVLDAIETTPQRTRLPWFLAALTDADEIARRRSILLAAAILAALALATAIGVGGILDSRPTVIDPLSLDPAEVDAWVSGAYSGMVDLPALRLTVVESEGTKGRWSYDGHGHVRLDHYFNPNDAQPGALQLFGDDTMAETADLDGRRVWLEHTGQGNPLSALAGALGLVSDCPTPWADVGLESRLGRPTRHVVCGKSEMWLDVETRLPLKSIRGAPSLIGPTPDYTDTFEVLDFAIGPQPADLFVAPAGLATMDDNAFNCAVDPACASPAPTASSTPSQAPIVTPPPAPGEYPVPADVNAFVADVLSRYATMPPVVLTVVNDMANSDDETRYSYSSSGQFREETPGAAGEEPVVNIVTDGHWFESFGPTSDGRPRWEDHGPSDPVSVDDLGLGQRCVGGWTQHGFDLVRGRPALHVECDGREFWVDREWGLVVRSRIKPDPLGDAINVDEVVDVQFVEPPASAFELAPDAVICGSRGRGCKDLSGKPYVEPTPSPEASSPG